eukprot:1464619-Pyramimonas_sp.AAC.1
MPGVSASGRSSYVTVVDCVAVEGLSADPAGLDDRDHTLSALVGLTTDPEDLGDGDRETLGESDRLRRDPGPWVRLEAHSR